MRREHNPNTLQPLEWLMSDGHAYIDTGFIVSSLNIKYEVEYRTEVTDNSNAYLCICGTLKNDYGTSRVYGIGVAQRNRYYPSNDGINLLSGGNEYNILSLQPNTWHKLTYNSNTNKYFTVNVSGQSYSGYYQRTIINNYPLRLFAVGFSGSSSFIKIKSFKLWENNVQVFDMQPYFNQEPGMLNLIDNQFYTNAGTGEFLYN